MNRESGVTSQQLRLARSDHHSALSLSVADRAVFKMDKQHLRNKKFYAIAENAVNTKIWIATTIYVLVAIIKKRFNTNDSLYTILQILSFALFEKTPFDQLLKNTETQMQNYQDSNQLNLFD